MAEPVSVERQLREFRDDFDAMKRELAKVIVGHEEVIEGVLTAVVTGGHVLLESVPGLGKTMLVETLGEITGLGCQRIQFTPDLMPADLLGTYVVMETAQGRRTFEFQKGPLFSHIVLADHINRGMPKAQSALLEAMEGQTISVANETFQLPKPFFVMATQNPQEMEGTFPLPEPQLDRFLLKLVLGPPTVAELEEILARTTESEPPVLRTICDGRRILEMRQVARGVTVPPAVRRLVLAVVAATHPRAEGATEMVRRFISYGASPRGAQALIMGAKVRAATAGRREVGWEDVRPLIYPALRHRLILNFAGQAENVSTDRVLDSILESLAVSADQDADR